MACCNQRRAANRAGRAGPAAGPERRSVPLGPEVVLRYLGRSDLAVLGPSTGRRYIGSTAARVLHVAAGDAPALLRTGLFSEDPPSPASGES